MNPHQALTVCVRLFVIWLFWYALSTVTGVYLQANRHDALSALNAVLWSAGSAVLFCVALWFSSSFIARRLLPSATTPVSEAPSVDVWFSLGCALIGIWLLAKAIPALVGYLLIDHLQKHFNPESFIPVQDWSLLVSYNVFQLVFGVWLFLGTRGLRKAFLWARHA